MSETTLVFHEESQLADREALRLLLRSMLPGESTRDLESFVESLAQHPELLRSPARVSSAMRQSLANAVAKGSGSRGSDLRRLEQVARHERSTAENREAYLGAGKFNQDAVWYPNPTRFPHPRSTFETLPFARVHKIIDRSTPVTSAGSCFATEIAHHLQARGFHYVLTEPHYFNAAPYSMASAAWGTIFNVPAMRQLVEKSFGLRRLPRLLWRLEVDGRTVFRDPFREEVEFASVAEYEANYEPHLDACRRALLEAEVFVITLGLTEIWKLKADGVVLSRVPWRLSSSLVERQQLDVDENLAELELLANTLRRFNPRVQFIVSVSPVPLQATFRGEEAHVIAASHLSKSVLRVAAERFAADVPGVAYFPAFETVMYCTEQPFERDQRHVRRGAVARVMRLFHAMFVRDRGFAAVGLQPSLSRAAGELRFLLLPDWGGDLAPARQAILAYARSFAAHEPMQLWVWLPNDAPLDAASAEAQVAELLREGGLDPAKVPGITILAQGESNAPEALLELGPIVVQSGGSAERALLRSARERGAICADSRRGELREFCDSARELQLVTQALERGLEQGRIPAAARKQVELMLHGWKHHALIGTTPTESYHAMRALHVASGGELGALLSEALRASHPPRTAQVERASVLGDLDATGLARARDALDRDGYYVFEQRLCAETCERLAAFARSQPVWGRKGEQVLHFEQVADGIGQSATFDLEERHSLRSPDVQSLVIDPGFLAVAREYLGHEPIVDLIALWWSLPHGTRASSASGQLYHFDLDRPSFLKFFVYLTDVDLERGPHCFVRASHREPQRATLVDRRLSDEEVARSYDLARDEVRFLAPRGTIFAEDTRGLHKGLPLAQGERLVFQLEFASTLFGAPYKVHEHEPHFTPEFREAIARHPRLLQRFAAS